jgi:hypothetical protein
VAATITTRDPDTTAESVFLVTRREAVVLAVTLAVVVGAILLLVVASGQVASALAGPS